MKCYDIVNFDHEIQHGHHLPWLFLWGYIHASYMHVTHQNAESIIQINFDTPFL